MSHNNKGKLSLGIILGIMGFIAGIVLMIMGNWLIGASGSVASAGLAYVGYANSK